MCVAIISCSKSSEEAINIEQAFCTYRDGLYGPVTSEVTIKKDTSEIHDYVISNISGYPNTSKAFQDIGMERVLDRLVILEYSVLIGNGSNMKISGEGQVNSNGSINLDLTIIQDEESNYSIYLKPSTIYNFGLYQKDEDIIIISEDHIEFTLSNEEITLQFKISDFENEGCNININRQTVFDEILNENIQIEAELFYTGRNIIGTLNYTTNEWLTYNTIKFEL